MPAFDDIGDLLSPSLDLPVAGKVYHVPSPPALVGLRLQAAWAVTMARRTGSPAKDQHLQLLAEDTGTSLEQDALGPVYDEMVADGVSVDVLNHAGMTAYLWVVSGESAARTYWAAPLGKALTRPLPPAASTSTGAASTTRRPASSSGTTSRRRKRSGSKPSASE